MPGQQLRIAGPRTNKCAAQANQLTSDSSAASGTGSYKYTPLNQLCYAGSGNSNACASPPPGSIAYKYDAADNPSQKGAVQQAFNNAGEICWTASTSGACASPPSGATTYQYDTRGNRTSVTPSVGQAQALTYDQENRMTKFTAGTTTSYGYNGYGLRMCKVSGSPSQPCQAIGAIQFVWDVAGGLPLLLKEGSTTYVYGPGSLPLEQVSGSATYWYHHDQLGSTRLITNSTAAAPHPASYTYDPYGGLAAITESITNPFRFAGQYQDSPTTESGFYYLRARYYDPTTAQFTTVDPAVRDTMEPFGYASNSPTNKTDPTGERSHPEPREGPCGVATFYNFGGGWFTVTFECTMGRMFFIEFVIVDYQAEAGYPYAKLINPTPVYTWPLSKIPDYSGGQLKLTGIVLTTEGPCVIPPIDEDPLNPSYTPPPRLPPFWWPF